MSGPTRENTTENYQPMLENMLWKLAGINMKCPDQGPVISDYSTPQLQLIVFPKLFPYGMGTAKNKEIQQEVSLANVTAHLMRYSV